MAEPRLGLAHGPHPCSQPAAICILRADAVPAFGGDTQGRTWSLPMRASPSRSRSWLTDCEPSTPFLRGLRCWIRIPRTSSVAWAHADDELISVHPVVRVHPETGEKALFVQPAAARRIIDFTPTESRRILELFFDQITRPEYTLRFRWEVGDLAIWDNRATAHLAATDLLGHRNYHRSLYRVTVLGDRPVGPDGFQSESIVGAPLVAFNE